MTFSSEIKARADHAVDKIQVKYGNVWANEHGGNKGFFKGCKFTSKIIKVILRISGNYEGFLHGIEFVPADGPHCILGDMKFREGILPGPGRTIIVQSKNSYLSHISGGLDMYNESLCVNGLKLHWKELK